MYGMFGWKFFLYCFVGNVGGWSDGGGFWNYLGRVFQSCFISRIDVYHMFLLCGLLYGNFSLGVKVIV